MRFFHPAGGTCPRVGHAVSVSLSLVLAAASASAADRTGLVVDPSGRPLPRAHVRVTTGSDAATLASGATLDVFADETGHFALPASAGCQIEASLPGFRTTTVPCSAADTQTITLGVAPIEETVLVTATRTATPASQLGVSTTTFTADDIRRRQSPVVSELLRSVPGAAVVRTAGPGGVTGLFVRGGESSYNMVLVDGIPVNEPGGTFNFNNLTTTNVDRVEVVRGANSALFGSDAMSSVVQLFTRRGTSGTSTRPSLNAQFEGGSYGTMRGEVATSGARGRLDYSLGAARFSTDNRVPNGGFDNTSLSANIGTSLGAKTTLRGLVRAELGRTGTPGQTAYGRPDMDAYYDHNDVIGGVSLEQRLTRTLRQRATYSVADSRQASVNLVEDAPYTPSYQGRVAPFAFSDFTFDSRTTLRRHYASYQADWHAASGPRGDHRFTALADWNGERARLDDRMNDSQVRASRDNVGAALQHQLLWRRLSTTAGVRVERNDSFGTAVVPRGSASLALRTSSGAFGDTRLRGAAGLGIKEPTVLQSFSISPYFKGNPDLQPERARALEVGLEQRLAGDRVKLDATWFDNRYRNIIGLRSTGGYNSEYFNIGLTRARGAELGAEFAPRASVRMRAGYTFVDSAIVESTSAFSPVFAVGQWAFRRPRHSGFIQGSWEWQRLTADLSGTLVGRFVDSDFSSLEPAILQNSGRTVWNAQFSYRATAAMTGILSINNVTGRDYQEPLGYLALQRAVRAGVRVRF